ncbi:hypothetical protein KEM54_000414 [Ascosphaera aggregata]|nr:hypothetical protein KEM54_000414 [Ascosphaera aggregata]
MRAPTASNASATGAATPARSGYSSANLSASSSRSSSRAPQPNTSTATDAFPALPAAPKVNTLMAGLTRGTRRWDSPAPQQSAWVNESTSADGGGYEAIERGGATGGKKGKGKKKQVLYHFG